MPSQVSWARCTFLSSESCTVCWVLHTAPSMIEANTEKPQKSPRPPKAKEHLTVNPCIPTATLIKYTSTFIHAQKLNHPPPPWHQLGLIKDMPSPNRPCLAYTLYSFSICAHQCLHLPIFFSSLKKEELKKTNPTLQPILTQPATSITCCVDLHYRFSTHIKFLDFFPSWVLPNLL